MRMWIWQRTLFEVLDCPNRLDRILVAAHLSPSIAESTRLIKQGSVRWRRHYDGPWEPIRNYRAPLQEGWPWEVRVGHGPLRLLPREGRDGWDQYGTHIECMFPLGHQGLRSWTDLLANGQIAPWPYWRERWERFCANTFGVDRGPASSPQES